MKGFQKYAWIGPLKREAVLNEDLYKEAPTDSVRKACVSGFNVPDITCGILETETGPSVETLDEIKNLNGTIYARINNSKTLPYLYDSDNDNELPDYSSTRG